MGMFLKFWRAMFITNLFIIFISLMEYQLSKPISHDTYNYTLAYVIWCICKAYGAMLLRDRLPCDGNKLSAETMATAEKVSWRLCVSLNNGQNLWDCNG